MSKKPTVLMILDGYGLNDKTEGKTLGIEKQRRIGIFTFSSVLSI